MSGIVCSEPIITILELVVFWSVCDAFDTAGNKVTLARVTNSINSNLGPEWKNGSGLTLMLSSRERNVLVT